MGKKGRQFCFESHVARPRNCQLKRRSAESQKVAWSLTSKVVKVTLAFPSTIPSNRPYAPFPNAKALYINSSCKRVKIYFMKVLANRLNQGLPAHIVAEQHTSQLFEMRMRDTYQQKYAGIGHTPCHAP